MDKSDPRMMPLAFTAGIVSAFLGHLLGAADGGTLYHLPHQALLAVPLGMGAALVCRPKESRTIVMGAASSFVGLVGGAAILLLG